MSTQLPIFYNTIHLQGKELSEALADTIIKDHKVYVVMQYLKSATPSQVHTKLPNLLIGSIRRAMTNLTTQGKLEKTLIMKMGPNGKREHVWKLVW